jgi:glycosyltransferase involved in cell wall biosynthesis
MKKKIYFWSPYNSKVGTVNSVLNSARSINKYSKNFLNPYLIDTTGEWDQLNKEINIIHLRKDKFDLRKIKNKGFFWSRLFYILIFLFNFLKLKNLLKKDKPDYLIVHLITSLPLVLYLIFNFNTKLILRISGQPYLGIFRSFFWKILSKKIFAVTCPNNNIKEILIKKKIFPQEKIKVILDPVIDIKEILNQKKNKSENVKKDYVLAVGRLTKQKNFKFLVKGFKKLNFYYPNLKLYILGEGEEKAQLEELIFKLGLNRQIKLLGFKNNVYYYMQNARCLILTSISENPGHVLIEAAVNNCSIISSDCPTGPSEFLQETKGGFLFITNDEKDFIKSFKNFMEMDELNIFKKKYFAKKSSINYTCFRHFKKLEELFI